MRRQFRKKIRNLRNSRPQMLNTGKFQGVAYFYFIVVPGTFIVDLHLNVRKYGHFMAFTLLG